MSVLRIGTAYRYGTGAVAVQDMQQPGLDLYTGAVRDLHRAVKCFPALKVAAVAAAVSGQPDGCQTSG